MQADFDRQGGAAPRVAALAEVPGCATRSQKDLRGRDCKSVSYGQAWHAVRLMASRMCDVGAVADKGYILVDGKRLSNVSSVTEQFASVTVAIECKGAQVLEYHTAAPASGRVPTQYPDRGYSARDRRHE